MMGVFLLLIVFFTIMMVGVYYRYRVVPSRIHGEFSPIYVHESSLRFAYDLTWYVGGKREIDQHLFAHLKDILNKARRIVLIDMFLFNLHHTYNNNFQDITKQVINLLAKKECPVLFITDPINTSYGTTGCGPLSDLETHNISVCVTNLAKLQDNNLIYSPVWRTFLQWFGTGQEGRFSHPLKKGEKTTLRAMLFAANVKANHRKIVVADHSCMLTSANFHDASSYFSNTAVIVNDSRVATQLLCMETALAEFSGCKKFLFEEENCYEKGEEEVLILTKDLERVLLEDIDNAKKGSSITIGMLFLSHRGAINSLIRARERGVSVSVVLDDNTLSFGKKKKGYPNKVFAQELIKAGICVRFVRSQEEFHSKIIVLSNKTKTIVHTGSANLTRRSLLGTNLEANIRVCAHNNTQFVRDVLTYCELITSDRISRNCEKAPVSSLSYWLLRFQERTGTGAF